MSKPLIGEYALYEPKDAEECIRADFEAKWGYPPDIVVCTGGGWLVGPLVDSERIDKAGLLSK